MFFEIINAKKFERRMDKKKFFIQFSSYYLLMILAFIATFVSPNDIVHDPTNGGRSIIYIVIFGSSYLVLHLILGHLADKEFYPYKTIPFLITLFMMISAIFACVITPEKVSSYENLIWYSIAAYLLANSLVIFISIIRQMEDHFKIKAFSITPKDKQS